MKEKLNLVAEKAKMVGQLLLVPFVLAGMVAGIVGEKTGRFFKNHKRTFIAVGAVVVLLVSWLGTGFTAVGSQSVKIVRYPDRLESTSLILFEKPVAIVNDTDGVQIHYTYPRIPYIPGIGQTNIGAKEESYPLKEPLKINTKIELFPLSKLTGNPADENTTVYLVISGTMEVTDWETFLLKFDPAMLKDEEMRKMSRPDIAGLNVGSYFFDGNVDYWYQEFVARMFLADNFAKEYNLTSEKAVEDFIKLKRSWYWAFGPMFCHMMEEEMTRNPFPNSETQELAASCLLADMTITRLDYVRWKASLIDEQLTAFCEELDPVLIEKARSILVAFKEYLSKQEREWPVVGEVQKELSEFLIKNQMRGSTYSPEELYAARTLVALEIEKARLLNDLEYYELTGLMAKDYFARFGGYYSEGNISLWRAAIQSAFSKKELSYYGIQEFYTWLKDADGGMGYLEESVQNYAELLKGSLGGKIDLQFQIVEETAPQAPETQAPAK